MTDVPTTTPVWSLASVTRVSIKIAAPLTAPEVVVGWVGVAVTVRALAATLAPLSAPQATRALAASVTAVMSLIRGVVATLPCHPGPVSEERLDFERRTKPVERTSRPVGRIL
jgi:hypothetical protein